MPAKPVYFSRLVDLEQGVCLEQQQIVIRTDKECIPVLRLDEMKLLGNHNVENYMAAIAIATKKNAGEEVAFIAQKTYIVYPPTIMMSPWAKLSIFAMPYTIV